MKQKKISIKNDISEVARIGLFLDKLAQEWVLSGELVFELNLMLEELVVNIIHYGYTDDRSHEIRLLFSMNKKELTILVEDDGVEFNILEIPLSEDIDKKVEERKIGGLGIHFIKSLANQIQYKRQDGLNILTITKKW